MSGLSNTLVIQYAVLLCCYVCIIATISCWKFLKNLLLLCPTHVIQVTWVMHIGHTEMWNGTKTQTGSERTRTALDFFLNYGMHYKELFVNSRTAPINYSRSTYMSPDGWWARRCACSWQHLVSLGEGAAGSWAAPAAWGWVGWNGRWCTRHGTSHSQGPRIRPCRAGAAEGPLCLPHTAGRHSGKMRGWQTVNTDLTAGWRCRS